MAATEPSIEVTRDTVVDRVTHCRWNEVEGVGPLPKRKLLRDAEGGIGFHEGLAIRYEGEGIWVIRIDAELVGKRTPLGRLNCDETKIVATIPFADESTTC